jgi:hypothetical protein
MCMISDRPLLFHPWEGTAISIAHGAGFATLSERVWGKENLPLPGFGLRTVQPVASRCKVRDTVLCKVGQFILSARRIN